MLTEKMKDVVKTTQIITQTQYIYTTHSKPQTSYSFLWLCWSPWLSVSQVLCISWYRTTDMISQLVRTQGVWLGAELVPIIPTW